MATMKPQILSKKLIKPSTPTPTHLRTMKLSLIDQLIPPTFINMILYYSPTGEFSNNHKFDTPKITQLEDSLSEALTKFYPLAGRMNIDDLSVDCNDQGVEFFEARVRGELAEFLRARGSKIDLLDQFVPWEVGAGGGYDLAAMPLAAIQVNSFDCGGVVLGVRVAHKVADAYSTITFVNGWAAANRAGIKSVISPSFDAGCLLPPSDQLPRNPPSSVKDGARIVMRRFVFGEAAIQALVTKSRAGAGSDSTIRPPLRVSFGSGSGSDSSSIIGPPSRANFGSGSESDSSFDSDSGSPKGSFSFGFGSDSTIKPSSKIGFDSDSDSYSNSAIRPPSRVVVVSALIWKALIGVSKVRHGHARASLLVNPMNLRGRTGVSIHEKSFGNLVTFFIARFAGEESETTAELGDLVGLLGDAARNYNPGKTSSVDELCSMVNGSFGEARKEKMHNENVDVYLCASWCGSPMYEADFGWGRPVWVTSTRAAYEVVCLIDNECGDGIEAWVSLNEKDMVEFERSSDILSFASR